MIRENYIENLVKNIPMDVGVEHCEPENILLVTEGGAFNGSYLMGVYYFLREMQRQNLIRVHRISSCSVSTLCGLLFLLDRLDLYEKVHRQVILIYKQTLTLDVFDKVFTILNEELDENAYLKVRGKLYISYYDLRRRKKHTRTKFKSNEDMFHTMKKSGFVPYLIDRTMTYGGKFIDGIFPHILHSEVKRVMYVQLINLHNLGDAIKIKNEENIGNRIMYGILDAHSFFVTEKPTQMCSYIDNWSFPVTIFVMVRTFVEYFVVYAMSILLLIQKHMPSEVYRSLPYKLTTTIVNETYKVIIQHYFV